MAISFPTLFPHSWLCMYYAPWEFEVHDFFMVLPSITKATAGTVASKSMIFHRLALDHRSPSQDHRFQVHDLFMDLARQPTFSKAGQRNIYTFWDLDMQKCRFESTWLRFVVTSVWRAKWQEKCSLLWRPLSTVQQVFFYTGLHLPQQSEYSKSLGVPLGIHGVLVSPKRGPWGALGVPLGAPR